MNTTLLTKGPLDKATPAARTALSFTLALALIFSVSGCKKMTDFSRKARTLLRKRSQLKTTMHQWKHPRVMLTLKNRLITNSR